MRTWIMGASGFVAAAVRERLPFIGGTYRNQPVAGCVRYAFFDDPPPAIPPAELVILGATMARTSATLSDTQFASAAASLCRSLPDTRTILLSSDAVFGGRKGLYAEDDKPDAVSEYGRRQALLEGLFLAEGGNKLVVRTSFVYGIAGGRPDSRLANFLGHPLARKTWPANIYRSPTEVGFLVDCVARVAASQVTGVLHVAGSRRSLFAFFCEELPKHGISVDDAVARDETDPAVAIDTSLSTARLEAYIASGN